jgi:hypothetical protein
MKAVSYNPLQIRGLLIDKNSQGLAPGPTKSQEKLGYLRDGREYLEIS